jgi:hypothetical protein
VKDGNVDALQAQIGAGTASAGKVRETLAAVVASEAGIGVGPMVTAVPERGLAETVILEAAARDDIEHAIAAVAVIRCEPAALCFECGDVLRIELRAARRQVAVRHRHAVDLPGDAVSASGMEVVVHDERAGHVVGNHRQAAGPVGKRLEQNVLTIGQRCRRGRFTIDRLRARRHQHRLGNAGDREAHLDQRQRIRDHLDLAVGRVEPPGLHRSSCVSKNPVGRDERREHRRLGRDPPFAVPGDEALVQVGRYDPELRSQLEHMPVAAAEHAHRGVVIVTRHGAIFVRQQPEQHRFARTVGPDDSRVLAGGDRERNAVEDAAAVLLDACIDELENVVGTQTGRRLPRDIHSGRTILSNPQRCFWRAAARSYRVGR